MLDDTVCTALLTEARRKRLEVYIQAEPVQRRFFVSRLQQAASVSAMSSRRVRVLGTSGRRSTASTCLGLNPTDKRSSCSCLRRFTVKRGAAGSGTNGSGSPPDSRQLSNNVSLSAVKVASGKTDAAGFGIFGKLAVSPCHYAVRLVSKWSRREASRQDGNSW